jgi:hypothetical protein
MAAIATSSIAVPVEVANKIFAKTAQTSTEWTESTPEAAQTTAISYA